MVDKKLEALRKHYLNYSAWSEQQLETEFKPGTLGFHEAFHMTSVVNDIFERNVLSHPVIISNKELFRDASEIYDKIFDLYHKLGVLYSDAEDKEKIKDD